MEHLINSQDVGLDVELSRVEGRVDSQVDGVLGLASVVVVDEGRVRGDLVAGGEPADQVFLKMKTMSMPAFRIFTFGRKQALKSKGLSSLGEKKGCEKHFGLLCQV